MNIDVNQPVTNPGLVVAIRAMRENRTEETDTALIRELRAARYLTPVEINGEIHDGVIQEGGQMRFRLVTSPEGQDYFPVFTDWEAVDTWVDAAGLDKRPGTLVITYEDLAEMVRSDPERIQGFVLNMGREGLVVTGQMIQWFDAREAGETGLQEQTIQQPTRITIGRPKKYPLELVAALANYFGTRPEVERAWFFLAKREDEEHTNYLVVVEFDGDESLRRELFSAAAQVAAPHLEGKFLDLMAYGEAFTVDAASHAEPIYQK